MIWFDVQEAYEAALLLPDSVANSSHENLLLLDAINTAAGVVLPEVRSDALYVVENGVTGVRFMRARNRQGVDSGYMALVIFNGAAALVARSDRLLDWGAYHFFATEQQAFSFVEILKKRKAMPYGARVQFEAYSKEKGFGVSLTRTAKVQAYSALRVATKNKYHADKTKKQVDLYAITAIPSAGLTVVSNHANAWLVAATAQHAAAVVAYQALGGLVSV
jgi:hypothetical protein